MTKVEAVNNRTNHRNYLGSVVQGAAIGAGSGYALKYLIPLTKSETNNDEYRAKIKEIKEDHKKFGNLAQEYLSELRKTPEKSAAQDEFIKMFEGLKKGSKMKKGAVLTAVRNLEKNHPKEVGAFLSLCKELRTLTNESVSLHIDAYRTFLKKIRPTSFFLATGVIAGVASAIGVEISNSRKQSRTINKIA